MAKPLDIVREDWNGPKPKVSVVILTLDEEINIAECLRTCAWSDDVHVLDSGSRDRTVEIARAMGAKVYYNPFESFGKQRNWAIENIPCKHDWIFHLDADERFTPELVREIDDEMGRDPEEAGYYVANQTIFMGSWIKWASSYPTYQMRLFHKHRMRFVDHGHGQREQPGTRVGRLRWPYVHHSFSKGLDDWFYRHNAYSTREAMEILSGQRDGRSMLARLFSPDHVERRRALKRIGSGLPLRPQLRWLYTLILQGGLLDGRAGLLFADLLAVYERMIQIKLRSLRMEGAAAAMVRQVAAPPAPPTPRLAGQSLPKVEAPVHEREPDPPVSTVHVSPPPPTTGSADAIEPPAQEPLVATTPGRTTWSLRQNMVRAVWMVAGRPLFRMTFHNWYGVRATILRFFGATLGKGVKVRPTARVDIPWNLYIGDDVVVGDFAILYALGPITIGPRTVISQYAHLCAGTHDHTSRRFTLQRPPITIGADCWIATDAYVGPGVVVGDRSVLGARSSVFKSMDPDTIYVGNPAKAIRRREITHEGTQ